MKIFVVLAVVVALAAADDFYKTGNDNLDVDKVMKNRADTEKYLNCFLDKGPCDPLALSYKLITIGSLATACKQCDDGQKHLWFRFLTDLKQNYPVEYKEYQQKYDPKNVLIPALLKAVSKY